ncbi:MAG: hypothetical protein M1825_002091 [Sarcosagium campestre]|nr:MAG: hypothetical protein M1825_002091 [Sarcosagium campestre]
MNVTFPVAPGQPSAAHTQVVSSSAHQRDDQATPSGRDRSYQSITHAPSNSISNESRDGEDLFDERERPQLLDLARLTSAKSYVSSDFQNPLNPFLDTQGDARLDPLSDKFSLKFWIRSLLSLQSRDPERYPGRTAGVSFKNLGAVGYSTSTDYQKTVGNATLSATQIVRKAMGHKGEKIQILKDFDGLVRDGEMLVVLGRPGSGCTTLLKTIACETNGFFVDPGTEINYQGIPQETMAKDFRGEVIYNAETDVHFPNLTVGQTLGFAAEARAPRNRLPEVTREQYALTLRDVFMAVFGLTHTLNTKVGNDFIRGISGGERKRVSIAEAALVGAPLQCWDNSTRGLDSATALEFVRTLRLSSKFTNTTAIVAIYQASQEIYDIFDKVVLLYEGRQIFFGRKDEAKAYFLEMGFDCPLRQTTADFLTSLTSPAERIARLGFEDKVPRTPDEFAKRWEQSHTRKQLLADIDSFNSEFAVGGPHLEKFKQSRESQKAKRMRPASPYTISIPMQVRLCVKRGFQRLSGDLSLFITSVFGNFCLSIIIGSIFYNLPANTGSFYSRGALLFFAILLNAFSSALEILTLYAQRPIVEKQAKYALYHPASEAIASMITDLPAKILTAVSFNLTIYFLTNLRREVGPFFVFFLFSFVCTLSMSMIFRTIGSVSRTIHQAMAPAAIFILALIIYTGFVIPTRDMHPWFRWINYVNPIGYAFESLMLNEFRNREFPCSAYVPAGPAYENVSSLEKVCSTTGAITGSSVVQGSNYLSVSFEYVENHMWRNLGIIIAFVVFFCFTHLYAVETISAASSKGEVLVFRRGHLPSGIRPKKIDEESPENTDSERGVDIEKNMSRASGIPDIPANIQRQTAIFHWKNVCYDIKVKGGTRRLLDHVDGWVKPGTLTALMGASGAGKTTLLDVLASRVTMGVVTGDMLVDGRQRDGSFQRKTGYVQQQDLHLQTSTVREALTFSALLRQPKSTPKSEKIAYVSEVIRLLEMEAYADAIVGVPGEGLNVEQRKRLTIGVELAAKPKLLLFLDEPTSGLDSQTAWSICELLRKLANNGQAILCTIHQPSALLFQSFDRLLFLAEGGKTVYFGDIGENSRTMIDYFERNGAARCPPDANPAEWILQVIGAAPGSYSSQNWGQLWRDSPERSRVLSDFDEMRDHLLETTTPDGSEKSSFAVPFSQQLPVVTKRVFEQYWRTPSYIYSKAFLCIASSLFIGFSFWRAENSLQGLQNQMFAVFMLMTIFGNIVQQIMPHFVTQRSLYEVRERPSRTYSWQSFILSNIIVEIPWNTLMAIFIFFCWYYPIGLYRNAIPTDAVTERGGLMFLLIWAFLMFTSTFTDMIIAGIDNAETGSNIAQLMFSLTLIFCGVLVSPTALPGFWIFMYRISPFTYLVSAMLSVAVANTNAVCSDIEIATFNPPAGQTCAQYLAPLIDAAGGYVQNPNATSDCGFCSVSDTNTFLAQVSSTYSHRWRDFGVMWAFIVFNIFGAVFLYWLVRVPKGKGKKEKKE